MLGGGVFDVSGDLLGVVLWCSSRITVIAESPEASRTLNAGGVGADHLSPEPTPAGEPHYGALNMWRSRLTRDRQVALGQRVREFAVVRVQSDARWPRPAVVQ
jgi:hypothetical protein